MNKIINLGRLLDITFITNNGDKLNLNFKSEERIEDIIKEYFFKIWYSEIKYSEDEIIFSYSQKKHEFDDETKLKDFFGNVHNPIIDLNDINHIFPSLPITRCNVLFKSSNGIEKNVETDLEDTMENLLKYYLNNIEHPELIVRKDKIKFLFNAQSINFEDKKFLKKYFKNEKNPIIKVIDLNNYLLNNSSKEDNYEIFGRFVLD